ncbi:hypothetical protein [Amycolatopsis kentuckyensis]|uniref:hypothetical protein n=1 Tax=Amycolatopsis kentuckyensis TaxID=218823 RepID=UPI0011785F34|nr:hypothetical protein [Amycolatopsis kentuckyensis]
MSGPRFSQHLNRALEANSAISVRAGHIWANAFSNDRLPEACVSDVTDLPIPARQGAAETMATAPHLAPGELVGLFNNGDPDVRKAAVAAI